MLPLHWACMAGQTGVVKLLLKNLVNEIADQEDESIMIEDDAYGRTPPILAASSGNLDCLQVITKIENHFLIIHAVTKGQLIFYLQGFNQLLHQLIQFHYQRVFDLNDQMSCDFCRHWGYFLTLRPEIIPIRLPCIMLPKMDTLRLLSTWCLMLMFM